jgi:hypothetical protein
MESSPVKINYRSILWQRAEEYINHGDDEPKVNFDSTFFR